MESLKDFHDDFLVLCDFDGTITRNDVVDAFLEEFAAPEWLEIEKRWRNQEIGSRECLEQQVALVRSISGEEMDAFIGRIELDPSFARFARSAPGGLAILSDGFDLFIRGALERHGLDGIPFFANRLEWRPGEAPRARFPYGDARCASATGACKCRLAERERRGRPFLYVGDGQSDYCIAGRADLVLAKGRLARFCEDEDIPFVEFQSFEDLMQFLQSGTELQLSTEVRRAQ